MEIGRGREARYGSIRSDTQASSMYSPIIHINHIAIESNVKSAARITHVDHRPGSLSKV